MTDIKAIALKSEGDEKVRAGDYHAAIKLYLEAVQRERSSSLPLPGMIDVDRLERVTAEIGRCWIFGLEKVDWIEREREMKLCLLCWGREVRS